MFLIAGLIGMVVSGVMMIAPFGAEEDTDSVTSESEDLPAGGDGAADAPSPLTVASESEGEDVPDRADGAPQADPRDLMPDAHVSDGIAGSDAQPILFRGDAQFGSSGDDDMAGGDRNDLILAGDGDDAVSGGDGRDEVQGGSGDDHLRGGGDDDILWGEDGADRLGGGNGADFLSGGDGADTLDGGAGDDRIFGGHGADVMRGGLGADLLDGSVIRAGAEVDTGDTLDGGAGDDTLAGGAGDLLTGGDGADHFLFRATPPSLDGAPDLGVAPRIADFDPSFDVIEIEYFEGEDTPDLSISRTESGSELRLDGELVAFVAGPATVDATHVALIARG